MICKRFHEIFHDFFFHLRLANIQPGELVCDPMCGGGSIPIEGALAFKQGFYFAGDFHEKAVERTKDNLKAFSNRIPSDGIQWDVTNIPLRDNCLDVLISDLVSKIERPLLDLFQKNRGKGHTLYW